MLRSCCPRGLKPQDNFTGILLWAFMHRKNKNSRIVIKKRQGGPLLVTFVTDDAMSALGQKQTCAPQNGMSALLPKADTCGATRDVCFSPIADSCTAANSIAIRSPFRRVA